MGWFTSKYKKLYKEVLETSEIRNTTNLKLQDDIKELNKQKEEFKARIKALETEKGELEKQLYSQPEYELISLVLDEICTKNDLTEFGEDTIKNQIKESITEDILNSLKNKITFEEDKSFNNITITGKLEFYNLVNTEFKEPKNG